MKQGVLSGTDQEEIYKTAKTMLDSEIESMGQSGQLPLRAVLLYNNTETYLNQPDAEQRFLAEFQDMTQEERDAYSNLRLTDHLLESGSYIVEHRNRPDDGNHNAYNIEEMLIMAREAGYTAPDLEEFLSDVRIWKAITPHPTEHLNDKGIELFRQLVGISELEDEKREEALHGIVKGLLSGDITPQRRLNTFEETDFALKQAKIYREGQRKMFRRVNSAIGKAFDGYVFIPDLKRSQAGINTGMRVWHAGGDADGKANADRWALLYGMLSLTRGAVEDHLNDIQKASDLISKGTTSSLRDEWQRSQKPFTYVQEALEQLRGRIEQLERRFIHTDEQGNRSIKEGVNYDVIKEDFANLFNGLKIGKITFETRKGFERELTNNFKFLARNICSPEAQEILSESVFMMRQYGLSAAIIETRHNGIMLKQTVNNIFDPQNNRTFIESLNLPDDTAELLRSKPKFVGIENEAEDLSTADQKRIMDYVLHNTTPAQRREAFLSANPRTLDDNGYPAQNHEIFERYSLMSMNPGQFGMAIIAEADEMSTAYQRFLSEPFGATTLLHTPLNEEYETIMNMPDYLERHHMDGGQQDIRERALMGGNGEWFGHNMTHGQMVPCSDSLKEHGCLVRVLETEGFRQAAARSISLGIATLIKRGNGLSIERGGGDEMIYTRYIAQILQEQAERRGKPFDPKDPKDRVLLQMASFFSNTEQGRAIRVHSATPDQVADDLCEKIGEMLGRRMELQGLVHKGTFIPPRGIYSPPTHAILMKNAYEMMQLYSAYRHAKSEKGEGNVLDNWAKIVSDPALAGAANNSARAQSKSTGKSAERLTKQRAIGSNIWLAMARTRHDGYFTCGEFLERLHKAYNDGQLSKQHLKQFSMDSQWWRRNFFLRALTPAVRSDMSHGFERLGVPDMTFDKAVEIGKTVRIEDGVFKYDDRQGTITEEQALHAAIFKDQVLLAALTEAGLAIDETNDQGMSPFDRPIEELIQTVRPDDNSTNVRFGSRTLKRWPQLVTGMEQERHALPEMTMADFYEAQISNGENVEEPVKRLAISAVRAGTMPDMRMSLGRTAYGRRQQPVWGAGALIAPPKHFRPETEIEPVHEQPGQDALS